MTGSRIERERAQIVRERAIRWGGRLLLLLVLAYAVLGDEGLLKQYRRYNMRAELKQQLAIEVAENDRLVREIEALKRDDLVIERAIRAELDFLREGEVVLIVEDDDPLIDAEPAASAKFDKEKRAP